MYTYLFSAFNNDRNHVLYAVLDRQRCRSARIGVVCSRNIEFLLQFEASSDRVLNAFMFVTFAADVLYRTELQWSNCP